VSCHLPVGRLSSPRTCKRLFSCNRMPAVQEEYEPPLRKSLFDNVPPFLNYLPNGMQGSEAAPCEQHTDNMVELRYSLWRVPMALHAMVTAVEEEKVNKERKCTKLESKVSLPRAFMRVEKGLRPSSKRLFRKSQVIRDENIAPHLQEENNNIPTKPPR